MVAALGSQFRRHGLQLAGKKQIEQERFKDVITVMAQRDLGRAQLRGEPVEMAAPETEQSEHVVWPSGISRLTIE